jgi:hypothetical protein
MGKNLFIEVAVPHSQVRKLSDQELDAYRMPFAANTADHIPTYK